MVKMIDINDDGGGADDEEEEKKEKEEDCGADLRRSSLSLNGFS